MHDAPELRARWLSSDGRYFSLTALGEALLDLYLERGWIQRERRTRAVHLTPKGREGFRRWFVA
jgi:hypothetical protein